MKRYPLILTIALLLGASPAAALVFEHGTHLETHTKNEPCATCHVDGASSITPEPRSCRKCHAQEFIDTVTFPGPSTHGPLWALNHGPAARPENLRPGTRQTIHDCGACHDQQTCLECHAAGFGDEMGAFSNHLVNVHEADFNVTHPIAARTAPQRCATCHPTAFCQDCHNRFAPEDLAILSHRKGWSNLTAGPDGPAHQEFDDTMCQLCHTDAVLSSHDWSDNHGREARKNLATCQACHPDGDICLQCHSATTGLRVNPHPDDWDSKSGRLERASSGRTCARCH